MKKRTGGWITHSKNTVYDNNWIAIEHHEVTTPKGTPGIYGVVHFKHHAVGIIPVDDEGNTWLVRQSRYALDEYSWEIPEGGAELTEAPLEAAKRELREETGLTASRWEKLLDIHPSNSVTDQGGSIFLAQDLSQGEQALEDSEDIEVKKIPLTDAIDWVLTGKITDSLSIAGLLRLAIAMKIGPSI